MKTRRTKLKCNLNKQDLKNVTSELKLLTDNISRLSNKINYYKSLDALGQLVQEVQKHNMGY